MSHGTADPAFARAWWWARPRCWLKLSHETCIHDFQIAARHRGTSKFKNTPNKGNTNLLEAELNKDSSKMARDVETGGLEAASDPLLPDQDCSTGA